MTSQVDRAAEFLFPATGSATLNVKFLCGGMPNITVEALAEQIVRAELQIRNSTARLIPVVDGQLTHAQ